MKNSDDSAAIHLKGTAMIKDTNVAASTLSIENAASALDTNLAASITSNDKAISRAHAAPSKSASAVGRKEQILINNVTIKLTKGKIEEQGATVSRSTSVVK